jgi:peptide/nickel transport system ATP-binding protein
MPVCKERFPGRTELGAGRWVNCYLYGAGDTSDAPA